MIKSAKIIRIRADLNLDYASNDEKSKNLFKWVNITATLPY